MKFEIHQIQNKTIKILGYSVSDKITQNIEHILKLILNSRGCDELYSPVYTCVKELLVNAVKANFKNIYFEGYRHSQNPDNPISYEMALRLFKLELSRKNAEYFSKIARTQGLKVEISFHMEGDCLQISITNPVAMTEIEQDNVNRKLNDARVCGDISEYFLKIADDPNQEGAGLGLVLISIMLKNLGVAEDKFTIRSEGSMTKASLTIPLAESTIETYRTSLG